MDFWVIELLLASGLQANMMCCALERRGDAVEMDEILSEKICDFY